MKQERIPTENWFHKGYYIHKATGTNTDYTEMPDGWDVTLVETNENTNERFATVLKAKQFIDETVGKEEEPNIHDCLMNFIAPNRHKEDDQ